MDPLLGVYPEFSGYTQQLHVSMIMSSLRPVTVIVIESIVVRVGPKMIGIIAIL